MKSTMDAAISELSAGRAVVFPTDTVYGLGISIKAADGPGIIYDIKERSLRKPIAWLVSGKNDLQKYGKVVPESVIALAQHFWPGPLTIIVRASDEVPVAFRSAQDTIGLRMPDDETALQLVRRAGCPLATSSANIAGDRSPKTADELSEDLLAKVQVVLRDNEPRSGVSSTVVDCSTGHPEVLREGAIKLADIQALMR